MRSISRLLVAGVVAVATVAALVACAPAGRGAEPKALRIGMPFSVTLDPLNGAGRYSLDVQPVYEALWNWDQSENIFVPWLAESYELSDDRLSLTVTIRHGISFTDGTPLNAETIVASLEALLASPGGAYAAQLNEEYGLQLAVEEEYVLELSTRVPMIHGFFRALAEVPIASPTAMQDAESIATTPVGTGPYLFEEEVVEVSRSFVKNEDYWNDDSYQYDSIEFLYLEDETARLNALKSGQINVAAELSSGAALEAESAGFVLHEGAGLYVALMISDTAGEVQPAFADLRVRQAIQLAFDREGINEALNFGFGRVDTQTVLPGDAFYVAGGADEYSFDVERANDLMAEAGYEDGFEVVIPTEGVELSPYLAVVEQAMSDIGIRVTWETFPDSASWFGAAVSGVYPLLLSLGAYTDTAVMLEIFFRPSFGDSELEALIETFRTGSLEESEEAAPKIGERMLELALFTTFCNTITVYATDPEIEMVVGAMTPTPRIDHITPAS